MTGFSFIDIAARARAGEHYIYHIIHNITVTNICKYFFLKKKSPVRRRQLEKMSQHKFS